MILPIYMGCLGRKVEVDPETRAQAQKILRRMDTGALKRPQIGWYLCLAISGGDPSKADEAIKAVQKDLKKRKEFGVEPYHPYVKKP